MGSDLYSAVVSGKAYRVTRDLTQKVMRNLQPSQEMTECRFCGQSLEVPLQKGRHEIRCPRCQAKNFIVC